MTDFTPLPPSGAPLGYTVGAAPSRPKTVLPRSAAFWVAPLAIALTLLSVVALSLFAALFGAFPSLGAWLSAVLGWLWATLPAWGSALVILAGVFYAAPQLMGAWVLVLVPGVVTATSAAILPLLPLGRTLIDGFASGAENPVAELCVTIASFSFAGALYLWGIIGLAKLAVRGPRQRQEEELARAWYEWQLRQTQAMPGANAGPASAVPAPPSLAPAPPSVAPAPAQAPPAPPSDAPTAG